MRITFHGAARQVTGSAHLVEIDGRRILLDCGLFDTDRLSRKSPNRQFTFDPRSLDAVVVSHAHNDHIGRLPCLARAGYSGPIYATPATGDILGLMLRNSARIQREDARNAELAGTGEPIEPLFEPHDVEWVMENLRPLPYETPEQIVPGVALTFRDAGHILGSALVQLDFRENGQSRRFVFTGDLGRREMSLLPNPTIIQDINILVTESTYGNKALDPYDKLIKQLHAIVARASRLHAKIVIPAFSLGRTQRMVYCFQELFMQHKVPPIPVFVDSPLATRLTDIHREYPEAFTPHAPADGPGPALFRLASCPLLHDLGRVAKLNHVDGPLVLIASSGMCEAGRVRHHLRHTVEDPDNAIVIVSYQAEGTLGRQISEGRERIKIMDQEYDLNAAVYVLDGFSGHADRDDLAWWFAQTGGGIDHAFLIHGEAEALAALTPVLQSQVAREVVVGEPLTTYEV